jgi:hypothetical protein
MFIFLEHFLTGNVEHQTPPQFFNLVAGVAIYWRYDEGGGAEGPR